MADVLKPERINVLGVGVSAINMASALGHMERWIVARQRQYVCITGVHGVMESQRDAELRRIHNAAGLVTPDGMPMVWLLWAGGYRTAERVYGPDLMLAVLELSVARGYRHFFYGASETTLARLEANLHHVSPRVHCRQPFPPISPAHPWRGRRCRRDHQRRAPGCRLGRSQHAETGTMDGGASRPSRSAGPGRGRGGPRLPCWCAPPGASLHATRRYRMAVPPRHGAPAALEALPAK